MRIKTLAAVALLVLGSQAKAGLVDIIDLTGSGGNLGTTATFAGIGDLILSVSAFTSNPTIVDTVRQNGNGLGTGFGANNLGNDDSSVSAQLLSFSVNLGRIVGIEVRGFGPNEELTLVGSPTNGPPTVFDPNFSPAIVEGVSGNPDFFAIDTLEPFLHVVSSIADLPTGVRVSAIHVDVPEPGTLALMSLGLLALVTRRKLRLAF